MAKIARKNKKSGGVYGKSDKKYEGPEPDYKTNDHLYGEVAKSFKEGFHGKSRRK